MSLCGIIILSEGFTSLKRKLEKEKKCLKTILQKEDRVVRIGVKPVVKEVELGKP